MLKKNVFLLLPVSTVWHLQKMTYFSGSSYNKGSSNGKNFVFNGILMFYKKYQGVIVFNATFNNISVILPNIIYMDVIKCLTSWTSPKAPLPITLTTSKSLCCIRQLLANSTGLASEML